ncbi:phosphatase and actin regulator 2 isoform X3 [Ascaphus truei]|uniref:phosphatase and actin regulator 2 isoform X3 n=1 Tax=Ascaphus truei TaxID=8439 RepID=UPI003F5AA8FB
MGQTSVSTLSEQAKSVDGLDKASIANSDAPNSGNQTPPLKRKGRLSSIGKIFKPWKWRKKKASEKFRETSAVLERKISMRQSRDELIRRGVLKEIPDQDGDVPVSVGTSNGHTVPISEEPPREEKPADPIAGNGSVASKAATLGGKTEELSQKAPGASELKPKKKAVPSKSTAAGTSHKKDDSPHKKTAKGVTKQPSAPPPKTASRGGTQESVVSSNSKKVAASKTSSSTASSSSSRSKSSKEQVPSKSGSTSTPRAKKVPSKTLAGSAEGSTKSTSLHTATSSGQKKSERTEQPPQHLDSGTQELSQKELAAPEQQHKPKSTSPALNHQVKASSSIPDPAQASSKAAPPMTISDINQLLQTDGEHKTISQAEENPSVSEENTPSVLLMEGQEENPSLTSQEVTDEPSEPSDISINQDGDSEGRVSQISDSDSDGPILYTDDDDDDDDGTESSLASKIRRRDSLAIKLGNRPSKKDLEDKNILPRNTEEVRQELWQQIGTKLVRRLSQRPTTEELEQRNILRQKNEEEEQEARRELKRRLTRKLSLRPSVAELQARRILCFNEYVEVTDSLDYDRRADKPWARLTPADKAAIRKELNEFKSTEMEVHEESRQFTRFHRP